MCNPNPWDVGVRTEIDSFVEWMSKFSNQHRFVTLQGAYDAWLRDRGFVRFADNYSMAVQVILVFLSYCIANPIYRRYLSHPDNYDAQPEVVEFTVLQINLPEGNEERTFWEFFTEESFHMKYADWQQSQAATKLTAL